MFVFVQFWMVQSAAVVEWIPVGWSSQSGDVAFAWIHHCDTLLSFGYCVFASIGLRCIIDVVTRFARCDCVWVVTRILIHKILVPAWTQFLGGELSHFDQAVQL